MTRASLLFILCITTVFQVIAQNTVKPSQPLHFGNWRNCYGKDASDYLHALVGSVTYIPEMQQYENTPGIAISLQARLLNISSGAFQSLNTTFYRLEMYHTSLGTKVKYNGPFDVCCQFLQNSTCKEVREDNSVSSENATKSTYKQRIKVLNADCPMKINTEFTAKVTKPLHRHLAGKWEATLVIYQYMYNNIAKKQVKDELLCIDIPFTLAETTAVTAAPPKQHTKQEKYAPPALVKEEQQQVHVLSDDHADNKHSEHDDEGEHQEEEAEAQGEAAHDNEHHDYDDIQQPLNHF